MVLGILAIAVPFAATLVTTIFLGWVLIVGGIVQAVHAIRARAWRGFPWVVVSAVIHLIAGVVLIAFPIVGTLTLTLVLAAFFAAEGVLKIIRSLQHRGVARWGFLLFDGIVTLALGVLLLALWPGASVWAIGLLVGVHLLVGGMSMLLLASSAGQPTRAAA
jgi:uncharacterized membrane protein HdeD (DUF308 family)